jgi:hypothetical protein
MREVPLTKEFLVDVMGACDVGPRFIEENNMWGQGDETVIMPALLEAGYVKEVEWWKEQKLTEKFVRATGSIFTMGKYKLFNSLTGEYISYDNEADARAAMINIAQQVLESHGPRLVQELSNEHGDTTWVPANITQPLIVS